MSAISRGDSVSRPFVLICHCEKAKGFRGNLLVNSIFSQGIKIPALGLPLRQAQGQT